MVLTKKNVSIRFPKMDQRVFDQANIYGLTRPVHGFDQADMWF